MSDKTIYVALGGLLVNENRRFTGSTPAEGDELLRAIKISSTTSIAGEVKPSAQYGKTSLHVKVK
jgi:hypothetical protein